MCVCLLCFALAKSLFDLSQESRIRPTRGNELWGRRVSSSRCQSLVRGKGLCLLSLFFPPVSTWQNERIKRGHIFQLGHTDFFLYLFSFILYLTLIPTTVNQQLQTNTHNGRSSLHPRCHQPLHRRIPLIRRGLCRRLIRRILRSRVPSEVAWGASLIPQTRRRVLWPESLLHALRIRQYVVCFVGLLVDRQGRWWREEMVFQG